MAFHSPNQAQNCVAGHSGRLEGKCPQLSSHSHVRPGPQNYQTPQVSTKAESSGPSSSPLTAASSERAAEV